MINDLTMNWDRLVRFHRIKRDRGFSVVKIVNTESTKLHGGYFEANGFHESLRVTVRLKISFSSLESLSMQKYPLRKN